MEDATDTHDFEPARALSLSAAAAAAATVTYDTSIHDRTGEERVVQKERMQHRLKDPGHKIKELETKLEGSHNEVDQISIRSDSLSAQTATPNLLVALSFESASTSVVEERSCQRMIGGQLCIVLSNTARKRQRERPSRELIRPCKHLSTSECRKTRSGILG